MSEKVYGIDLGTTYSCIATVDENGEAKVIQNKESEFTTPSVVNFADPTMVMVGSAAKENAVVDPDNTVSLVKTLMGRTDCAITYNGERKSPEEVSSYILRKVTEDAATLTNEEVHNVVITCPAYFGTLEKEATKNAGIIAGLNVLEIINEPTAAAISYGVTNSDKTQTVMVYDLGGGTFDVSIIEMGDGVQEVLATAGNNHLGGDDFDQKIIDWLVQSFRSDTGIDLSNDKTAMQRLKDEAEKAKIELSGITTAAINIPFITADATGPKHLDYTLTRAKFNELTADLVEKTMGPVRQALKDSGLSISEIDKVLMVGGSSRIPAVQDAVKSFIGKEPFKGINPDECVAIGACIQAGVLSGEKEGLLLLDVTPLSLGVETQGGVMTKIIDRNTTIPTKKSQIFSTAVDNQTQVEVNVLQGEREFARDNKQLGLFKLDGILPAMRGVPQIEVTFDIDANGIVNVSAKDLGTGKEQHITITSNTNMSKDDIEKAIRDAEQYAAEDKKRREEVDKRNDAENLVYAVEKLISENGDHISAEDKDELQKKVADVKSALAQNNIDNIQAAKDDLQKKMYSVSEKLYQDAAAQGAAQQQAPQSDNGVYDADFKDVE